MVNIVWGQYQVRFTLLADSEATHAHSESPLLKYEAYGNILQQYCSNIATIHSNSIQQYWISHAN